METYILDWAGLLLRWLHVITAIAWVGSSFYFVFLDSSLTPPIDDDLKKQGFHISLWQLTYFVPKNKYFPEIIEKNLHVKNSKGEMPYEDAVLDFSNPSTVSWYQDKLAGLLKMGVGAIKVDFGEAAPLDGMYASGRGGWYEHNLYPLRYNKAVAEITKKTTGDNIIWARSAWAGSMRAGGWTRKV